MASLTCSLDTRSTDDFIKFNENPNNSVRILIVSPNKEFKQNYKPLFCTFTNNKYRWRSCGFNKFESKFHDIKVQIYCTPFPHIDNNSEIKLNHYIKFLDQNEFDNMVITENDIVFVKTFYRYLNTLINNIINRGGIAICTSYAVFNTKSDLINIQKYKMFSEILDIFKCLPQNKSLLSEWVYKDNCYYTYKAFNTTNTVELINYTKPTIKRINGYLPIIELVDNELKLKMDLAKYFI